ncbi:MAG: AzlD domain-containing protein [Lautropia sp.]|nr:AzlD domain-containing protein [Lautropia sp.]
MISSSHALLAALVMGIVTFALRALPFVAADFLRKHRIIRELGRFLPAAILALLLLHTLLAFAQQDAPTVGLAPVLIAIATTIGLHLLFRHALLSIFAGTALYVLLRNLDILTL